MRLLTEILCLFASFSLASSLRGNAFLDFQKYKTMSQTSFRVKGTGTKAEVRLYNLNPEINVWYVLTIRMPGEAALKTFHLDNAQPSVQKIRVGDEFAVGLIFSAKKSEARCELWSDIAKSDLVKAVSEKRSYVPICGGRAFVRNQLEGQESTKEYVADLLRSHVPGGEQITSFVKDVFYKDSHLLHSDSKKLAKLSIPNKNAEMPENAKVNPMAVNQALEPKELGIALKNVESAEGILVGNWYPIKNREHIFLSAIQPGLVHPDILSSYKNRISPLDQTENGSLAYIIAFDLAYFDLDFALGTKHPSLEWSDRAPQAQGSTLKGPDGFDSAEPLVLTGKINPAENKEIVATFTGGFKRSHSAFKWGPLSRVHNGSHYGFLENGVIFSSLIPALATMIIYKDNNIVMKTWDAQDEALLPNVKHARQNGVPLLEWDERTSAPAPGPYVNNWSFGNWSGSGASTQRALRAGVCMLHKGDRRYLAYGYFSSVSPNAMARVFQAYGCRYAFHMDMNALEHTYLAVYSKGPSDLRVEHIIEGMNVLDRVKEGKVIPRFLGLADNRDFFYLTYKHQ